MDNTEQDQKNSAQPNSGQVMDVKVTPAPVETTLIPNVEAAGDPVTEEAVQSAGSSDEVNASTNKSPETNPTTEPINNSSPPNPSSGHKTGAPVAAIIAAVVVAVGLAAVTVYAYISSNDKAANTTDTNQNETSNSPAVTEQDVDETSNEVDGALNSTEETDFPDSELTDQSLGL